MVRSHQRPPRVSGACACPRSKLCNGADSLLRFRHKVQRGASNTLLDHFHERADRFRRLAEVVGTIARVHLGDPTSTAVAEDSLTLPFRTPRRRSSTATVWRKVFGDSPFGSMPARSAAALSAVLMLRTGLPLTSITWKPSPPPARAPAAPRWGRWHAVFWSAPPWPIEMQEAVLEVDLRSGQLQNRLGAAASADRHHDEPSQVRCGMLEQRRDLVRAQRALVARVGARDLDDGGVGGQLVAFLGAAERACEAREGPRDVCGRASAAGISSRRRCWRSRVSSETARSPKAGPRKSRRTYRWVSALG